MNLINTLLSFILGFIVGFVSRILYEHLKSRKQISFLTKGEGRGIIAGVVTIVWVVLVLSEASNTEYKMNPIVHGIMGSVVGYFFLIKDGQNKK